MSNYCSVCKRRLKSPTSIQFGMGPVCRSKYIQGEDSLQEVLDFMRAQWEVLKHERGKFIFIRDIGKICRSVTNDAEYVIKTLYSDEEITDETRIFYEDSYSNIDEILHAGDRLAGFSAGHKGVDLS